MASSDVSGSPYIISASGAVDSDYSISYVAGSLTVSPAPLTITANNLAKTYGQTLIFAGTEFTTSGLINGDTVTSVTLTSPGAAATALVNGSPYPIVPSKAIGTGLGNYTITYVNGSLTVNPAQLISDAGFEQVPVGAGQFQYRPAGSPWTFTGSAGIAGNHSGFTSGNPPAPEGVQVAFLQGTGSFDQSVAGWAAGTYTLSFSAAQRGNHQASRQDFSVLVDGVVVGVFTPSGTSYQSYTTTAFSVSTGSHTIEFRGLDSAGGDNTAFIDQIVVSS
jgi:hypothetical protein